jgi:hypothetical protein
MPVAQRLLATTDSAFQRVVSDNWFAGIFRMHVVPKVAAIAMSSLRVRKAAFRTLSQTGISYPDSPLSRTLGRPSEKAPRAGERFPWLTLTFAPGGRPEDLFKRLDDRRFNLLVIGQPAPDAESVGLGDLLRVHDSVRRRQRRVLSTVSTLRRSICCGPTATSASPARGAAALTRWLRDGHVHIERTSHQPVLQPAGAAVSARRRTTRRRRNADGLAERPRNLAEQSDLEGVALVSALVGCFRLVTAPSVGGIVLPFRLSGREDR